eukprot:122575_1
MPDALAIQISAQKQQLDEDKIDKDIVTISIQEENGAITLLVSTIDKEDQIIKGDTLSTIIFNESKQEVERDVEGLSTKELMKLLELIPLKTQLTFKRTQHKCATCISKRICSCCCKKSKSGDSVNQKKWSINKIVQWVIKFTKLSLVMIAAGSEMLNAATDGILLWKASASGAMMFTVVTFISILAPYILAYSSGVQIFLYRKTFENVQLFTFKSLLLGLYLFPTGVLYFVFLDIIDALLQLYIWFAFGVIGKIQTESDLAQIESNLAQYFGMSRMDWFSFKKQKIMAQLFFETVPQVALQLLLFFSIAKGNELKNITRTDLLLSIGSALFSSFMQIFRLRAESMAVNETLVHYSLNCITARFGWVPFKDKMEQFNELQKQITDKLKKKGCLQRCTSCFGDTKEKETKLAIDYNLQYSLPFITKLTGFLSHKSKIQPLQVGVKLKSTDPSYGTVEYDFSAKTCNTLIAQIKALDCFDSSDINQDVQITITFGETLRLLGVRSIISLMQACAARNIDLPDIYKIDWKQAFKNRGNLDDPRLFSHTFDEYDRTLLISLYLTGYNDDDYYILRSFISQFDVPVNEQDNEGNTILHHMVQNRDFDAIKTLITALKPKQRVHFDVQNDTGDTIIHEMIKQRATAKYNRQRKLTRAISTDKEIDIEKITDIDDYEKLKDLLQMINMTLKSGQKFNITAYNRLGESIMFLALQRDIEKLRKLNNEQINNYQISWNSAENENLLQIDPNAKKKLQSEIGLIVGIVEDEDMEDEIKLDTVMNVMNFIVIDDEREKEIDRKRFKIDTKQNSLSEFDKRHNKNFCDKLKRRIGKYKQIEMKKKK